MNKAIVGLFIGAALVMPVLASAKSSSTKPTKDTTPPSLNSIRISSSNANPSRAKAGDIVTLTFTANEKVTPIVLVETKTLFVKARNTSGNSWDATYTVNAKDRTGKVDYLLAMTDAAGNPFLCSSARLPLIKYCPTTDGSSVTVYKEATAPTDTQAPVIAPHANVYASTTGTSAAVSYTLPSATDNVDTSVAVSCAPASGSVFSLGTTTVTCAAQDTAGNSASSTFAVVVTQETPGPYTMASQDDESYLCGSSTTTWRFCDTTYSTSFTDAVGEGVKTIDLGVGSGLGNGTIQTVVLAKDPAFGASNFGHPWLISIRCFTDADYTHTCSDWAPISDAINDNPSGDGVHWSADFSSLNRTFAPAYHYQMTIDDIEWDTPAYGSESLKEPYWVITGKR